MLSVLHWIDVLGAFVFALSGAIAAVRQSFDLFGVFVISFITAIGGGVIRDLCINATPPIGLVNIEYLIGVIIAIIGVRYFQKYIFSFEKPSLFFDAIGLGFFSSVGTAKTYLYTGNIEISILLGCVTAIGGGILRDILSNRPPTVLTQGELYATPAIIGSIIEVLGATNVIPHAYSVWLSIVTCTVIRMVALKYNIRMPSIKVKYL